MVLERIAGALGEPWTLETMAAQAGLKRSRFAHYCRKLTNATPLEYLARLRVERAAVLLRGRPDRSITQIAFDCGFASSQYFATVFRRIEGCPPGAYRRQADPSFAS
jgi:AraC family L-rhamnose operon regulatory protein RhaS